MKRISIRTIIISSVLTTISFIPSKGQEVMPLWEEPIPGAIPNDSVYEERFYDGKEWLVKNVVVPTLTHYRAQEEIHSGTAVIICPGGAYTVLAIEKEGVRIAQWLNTFGISAFVLKYRLPDDRIMEDKTIGSLMDAHQAIKLVRKNATKWNIDPNRIGIMGFSAGGHLASTAATHFKNKVTAIDRTISYRPDFGIYVYPVINFGKEYGHSWSKTRLLGDDVSEDLVNAFSSEKNVSKDTPPAFIIHTSDDQVNYKHSLAFYEALKANSVEASLHIFNNGGHGYGLAENMGELSNWPNLCIKWMGEMGFLHEEVKQKVVSN